MKHTIIPTCGFANRIRVILAALQWSSETKNEIRILWIPDSSLACRFSKIFKQVPSIIDANPIYDFEFKVLKKLRNFGLVHNVYTYTDNEYNDLKEWAINPRGTLFAKSYSYFYHGAFPKYKDVFFLTEEVQSLIDTALIDIDSHTIGIHIRRTDNAMSIEKSPLHLFEQRMKAECESDSLAKFYLASDDPQVHLWAKDLFKDRVIVHPGPLNRDSEAGMIHAVVELYTLANCQKILGSYFSSFSELAAEIGQIRLETVQ